MYSHLSLSTLKTFQCNMLGSKLCCEPACVALLGKPLEWAESLKYLRVTFTSAKYAMQQKYIFHRNRKFLEL